MVGELLQKIRDWKPDVPLTPEQTPAQAVMEPLRQYGLEGLSPKAKVYAVKQPRQWLKTAYTHKAVQEQYGEQPLDLLEEARHAVSKGSKGLMWLLEQFDRPQDAAFSVIDEYLAGNRDPEAIFARAKQNWRGQDTTSFEDILEHMTPEAQDTLTKASNFFYVLGNKLLSQTTAGLPISVAEAAPADWEGVQKFWGTVGDFVLDPLLFAGGAGGLLAKGAKGLTVAGKAAGLARGMQIGAHVIDPSRAALWGGKKVAGAAGTAIRKWPTGEAALRKTVWRGTGIKEVDELLKKVGSEKSWIESGLLDDVRQAHKLTKPYQGKYPLLKLAEERRGIDEVLRFVDAVQSGEIKNVNMFMSFDKFSNYEAVRSLLKMPQADKEGLRQAVKALRGVFDKDQMLKIQRGQEAADLAMAPTQRKERYEALAKKALKNAYDEASAVKAQEIKDVKLALKYQKSTMKKTLGANRYAQLMKRAVATDYDLDVLRREFGKEYLKGTYDILSEMSGGASAIKSLEINLKAAATSIALQDARFLKYQTRVMDQVRAIEMLPNYVPHMATSEAMRDLARMTGMKGREVRNALADPTTASDIHRMWRDKKTMRALSLEEVQKAISEGKYKKLQKGPVVKEIADIAAYEPTGIIYKSEHLGGKIIRTIRKKPRELAEFFDTDVPVVMTIQAQRTARSLTASDYINEAMRLFTKKADDLTDLEKLTWEPIGKIPGFGKILRKHPQYEGQFVHRKIGNAMVQTAAPFLADPYSHPFARFADATKRWWISYTLPLYVAYHSRNGVGNFLHMNYAGFMEKPWQFADDMGDWFGGHHAQLHIMRNDVPRMRKIKFYSKRLNQEVDAYEMHQIAQRLGATDSGFFGHELEQLFKKPRQAYKRLIPGSTEFIAVEKGRAVGKFIEQGDRFTLFINRVRKGDTYEQAAATVKKYLGDFSSEVMTPFEREVATRVFPFYRWSRYNVPLTLEQLLFSPKNRFKLTTLRRIHERFLEPPTMEHGRSQHWVPEYIQEMGGVPLKYDRDTGDMTFGALENYIPAADIGNFLETRDLARFVLQQSAPPAQAFIEYAMGGPTFGGGLFEDRQRELLGRRWNSQTAHFLRKFRFIPELDRLDPFGTFHKESRDLPPLSQRLVRSLLGLAQYRTNPMRRIMDVRSQQIDKWRSETGRLRSPKRKERVEAYEERQERNQQMIDNVKSLKWAESVEDYMAKKLGIDVPKDPDVESFDLENGPVPGTKEFDDYLESKGIPVGGRPSSPLLDKIRKWKETRGKK